MAESSSSSTVPFHQMFADLVRTLRRDLFSTYRPERHYMRGPGPKWREKHAMNRPAATALPDAIGLAA